MNKKEKFSFLKGKGASVGIVLCFVAVIAMVGTVTFRNYKKNMNEQIAKVQQETEKLTEEKKLKDTERNGLLDPELEKADRKLEKLKGEYSEAVEGEQR